MTKTTDTIIQEQVKELDKLIYSYNSEQDFDFVITSEMQRKLQILFEQSLQKVAAEKTKKSCLSTSGTIMIPMQVIMVCIKCGSEPE